jgi:hypothetical protein
MGIGSSSSTLPTQQELDYVRRNLELTGIFDSHEVFVTTRLVCKCKRGIYEWSVIQTMFNVDDGMVNGLAFQLIRIGTIAVTADPIRIRFSDLRYGGSERCWLRPMNLMRRMEDDALRQFMEKGGRKAAGETDCVFCDPKAVSADTSGDAGRACVFCDPVIVVMVQGGTIVQHSFSSPD